LWVLLPVDEVLLRQDFQGIGQNPRTAMRRRTESNDLWTQLDRAVVAVMRDMVQGDMNRHGVPPASLDGNGTAQDLCHPGKYGGSSVQQQRWAPLKRHV
jgi:hypothetical protein